MFSAFAKIIQHLAHYPKASIGLFLALTLLCIYPIEHLRWDLQLQDTLNGNELQADYQSIENSFGGLGSLTVILQSNDSAYNYQFAKDLAQALNDEPLVHYVEYDIDLDFFKKNRLLYASEEDLSQVIKTLDKIKNREIQKKNPIFVNLQENDSPEKRDPQSVIKQIEEKYFRNLQQSFSNSNGTIRIVDIYPTGSLSDLQANRQLVSKVKDYVKNNDRGIKVYYTGKVWNSVKTGKLLLPEAKLAGKLAAMIIFILLIINFYKQPQLILVSALPMAIPTIFTFGLAYLFFGRINLFTLSLILFQPGHACQIISHVYTRYFHERERNLSPALCIESALLGIGPVVAASSLVMACLFIAIVLVPLPGLREFGILGATGSLLNLFICPLLTTSFLLLLQRKKPFNIRLMKPCPMRHFRFFSNRVNWIIIVTISIISSIGWLYSGVNLTFLYDFKKTEMQFEEHHVQTLIDQTGFSTYDPIILMLPDSSYNDDLVQNFEHLQKRGSIPDLGRLYTQYHFQPKITQNKKRQIENIRNLLDDDVLRHMNSEDSASIIEMFSNYENDVREFELSENIRRKFSDKNGNPGIFAFIIPSTDPDNGLNCRHIAAQIQKIDGIQDRSIKICGTPILRASTLDMILGNIDKSIMLGTVLLWLVLLMFYNKLSRAFFTMLPSLFAMSWVTILVHALGIRISAYSSLAFVLLIAASVDGSLQLWSSYYEKQGGSAWTVLRTKLISVSVAQGASFIGAIAMLLSSHPGIHSMGQITSIGLFCILISQFTIYPLIASTLDAYRVYKKAKKRHERLIHKNS